MCRLFNFGILQFPSDSVMQVGRTRPVDIIFPQVTNSSNDLLKSRSTQGFVTKEAFESNLGTVM